MIVDVNKEEPLKKTKDLTGTGFDIVFEATGNRNAIPLALEMIRPGGQVVIIGIHSEMVEFDPTPMVRSRKPIITHRLPLTLAEEAF